MFKFRLHSCTFHDFSSDPLGWLDNGHLSIKSTDFIHYLQKHPALSNSCSQGQQVAVMLCSLTNLLIHRSPSYTCRLLQRLVDTYTPPFSGKTLLSSIISGKGRFYNETQKIKMILIWHPSFIGLVTKFLLF